MATFPDLPINLSIESDCGMYDAISKGLRKSSGSYHCYINCGDLFDPSFFDVVAHFLPNSSPCWFIGLPASRDQNGHLLTVRSRFFTSQRLILSGYHNGFYDHFLQQESIFWHHELSRQVDLETLSSFRLAGDAYLWRIFATLTPPKLIRSSFSSYRQHPSPLSGNRVLYMREFYDIYPRRIKPLFILLFLLAKLMRAFESSYLILLRKCV